MAENMDMDKQYMTDEQMLYDVLMSQQELAAAYNRFAGENLKSQLSDIFIIISEDDIALAQQALMAMQANGWYNPQMAENNDIKQIKQQFKPI